MSENSWNTIVIFFASPSPMHFVTRFHARLFFFGLVVFIETLANIHQFR